MTRDEIARMAQEAAIMPPNWGATENQWRALHDFAALVAAAEREACAQLCERMARRTEDIRRAALEMAADAIHARGQA